MKTHPNLMSIDGIDGSGKSTQTTAVAQALRSAGVEAQPIVVRAYGARTVNDLAEEITGDRFNYHPAIPAPLREWTFACDVAHYCRVEFMPLLEQGITLVQDRGPLSYRAYAEYYGGFTEWVERAHGLFLRPHRTYLLDLPVQAAERRLRARTSRPRQTDEPAELLVEVRTRLLEAAHREPDVVVLDATVEPSLVTEQILSDWVSHRSPNLQPSA